MKKQLILATLLLHYSTPGTTDTDVTLSPTLLYFDYTEYDTSDVVLDRELGWLPGLQLIVTEKFLSDWSIDISGAYYQGTVDYTGRTQAGAPHSTQTDTRLLRLGAEVEKNVFDKTSLFIAARAHQWRRDIRNNNNVSGILETYRWLEYSAGFNYAYPIDTDNTLTLKAAYLITRNATIDVDLTRVNLGSVVLDIGNSNGGKVNLNWSTRYSDTAHIGLSLFFEVWNFARSNTKNTQGGSSSVRVTEPRSVTQNTGIALNIEYNF